MYDSLTYLCNDTYDSNYPAFQAVINGIKTPYFLIPAAIEVSMTSKGIYPLFNSNTSLVGFGGVYFQVQITPDTVIWETSYADFYDYENKDSDVNKAKDKVILPNDQWIQLPLTFDKSAYTEMVAQLVRDKDRYAYEVKKYQQDQESFNKGLFFYQ